MSLFIIALSVSLLSVVIADHPIAWTEEIEEAFVPEIGYSRNAQKIYRLPGDVVPSEYDIYIDLYFSERTERPFSYDGREHIIIQAVNENVTQIVLHSNVDSINSISLLSNNSVPVDLDLLQPFYTEQEYHFLKINLIEPMAVGLNYTLFIDYNGTMNEGPMKRGIWRGQYTDENNVERMYATTHFQPYNARQAFPCWDEPLYKASFRLHLSQPSSFRNVYSNTALSIKSALSEDRIQDHFSYTPKMSSYLVTFLVSETFTVLAQNTDVSPPIRIIGRSNTIGLADRTLNLTVKMTQYFDEYFQIPFASLHPNLNNDHVSSPDWASAGTENWGMISYRELYMIVDKNETIMSVEQYAATLIAHELAHNWFGNYITCFWWSNTWINEGFASYFGYIATHQVFPEYDLQDHFNSRYLLSTLSVDSGTGSVPMNHDVNTPAQVTGHFGTISYNKAASFLRMTVDIITPATFRKACQYFLQDNSYEPTDKFDLLAAFNRALSEDLTIINLDNFNFSQYYDVWVNKPGYPILKVNINHVNGEMELTQERFFLSPTAAPSTQVYPIPITYSTKSNRTFEELQPRYIMNSNKVMLLKPVHAGAEWVIFNNQQHGIYRVDYDENTWNLIAEALLAEPENIHHLNRGQIVADVFAFMRSSRMSYEQGFHILRFLSKEVNYHVWNPAISGLSWLRNRLRHIPEKRAEFDSIIFGYMDHVIGTLGFEPALNETATESLTRQELLQFACNIGHKKCVEDALQKFNDMKNGAWIDPRIRRHVYMTGIREGGREDFEFLLNRHQQSNYANDQLEMLRGLGATKDPQLLKEYLLLTLTQRVRSHDKLNSFNFALSGNIDLSADAALEFVKNNIDAMRVAYIEDAPPAPVNSALSNLAGYLNEPGLVDYENWLRSTQVGSMQFNGAISSINSARNNKAWGTQNADIILAAARGGAGTAAISIVLLVATLCFTRLI